MRKTRLALVPLLSMLAMALVALPVAAQPSSSAQLINELNGKLLYVAVPITLLVEAILIYTVVKFRNSGNPLPTRENRRLEITWTIATAIILLFVGVASYGVLADVTHVSGQSAADVGIEEEQADPVVVRAEAYQWGWEMSYPEAGNFTTGTEIVVPKDRPVVIRVTSRDVVHAFHVPELGLKQDAMPGQVNVINTVPYETGTYQGYCAEYCGVSHSQMYFTMEVVSQDQYQQWLSEQQNSSSGSGGNGGNGGNSTSEGQ
ncbi:cytochrome c oxidase subunit II [Halopelagius longus]|uniref:cytochrome-c oxidase n=1 Tax=Halopelagius longus TaxID=1236180 RepID=A0A1H1BU58_9EURY|nr:cytochrome c oxidase subunit II [Halopelagius longus]RDI70926.1 cytochrome c oxidase subunit II [Halopelagius longus]SDQ55467.1 cytochrome c oxidase subunit 2 [Halopelagius longus]